MIRRLKTPNTNRKFQGIWIPAEVWLDEQLSLSEKLFLLEINSLDRGTGCTASNGYLAIFFKVTPERCSQVISNLKARELIRTDYLYEGKSIKKRTIHVTPTGIKYIKGGIKFSLKIDNNIDNKNPKKDSMRDLAGLNLESPIALLIKNWLEATKLHPNVTTHQFKQSKTIKKIMTMLRALKSGTFAKHCNLDSDFLDRHKIPIDLLTKKWTIEEIKIGLDRLYLYCQPGYFPGIDPDSKSTIENKTSLEKMIYNEVSGSSILLWVFKRIPERAGHHTVKLIDAMSYPLYEKFFSEIYKGKWTQKRKTDLIRCINKIVEERKRLVEKLGPYLGHTNFSSYVGSQHSGDRFYVMHIRWMSQWKTPSFNLMKVGTNTWDLFAEFVRKEYRINIYPSKAELKAIKQEHDRALRRIKNNRRQ